MDKQPTSGFSRRITPTVTQPDYPSWALKEHWSVTEAAKLLCGRNPHGKIPGPQFYNRELRVIDIIDRAFEAAQAGAIKVVRTALLPIHLLVDPASFLRWAMAQGLTVPEPLNGIGEADAVRNRPLNEALLKERVSTIAKTLWIIDASLTQLQVAHHTAMRVIVPDDELKMADRLRWIGEAQEQR